MRFTTTDDITARGVADTIIRGVEARARIRHCSIPISILIRVNPESRGVADITIRGVEARARIRHCSITVSIIMMAPPPCRSPSSAGTLNRYLHRIRFPTTTDIIAQSVADIIVRGVEARARIRNCSNTISIIIMAPPPCRLPSNAGTCITNLLLGVFAFPRCRAYDLLEMTGSTHQEISG